jgi:hypothetical protein
MPKFTAKCSVAGCGREFTNGSQGLVNANLRNHMKWHERQGKPPESKYSKARPYKKKPQAQVPNYCPGCGCNIRAVAAAMSL